MQVIIVLILALKCIKGDQLEDSLTNADENTYNPNDQFNHALQAENDYSQDREGFHEDNTYNEMPNNLSLNEDEFKEDVDNSSDASLAERVKSCLKQHNGHVDVGYYTSNIAIGGHGGRHVIINNRGESRGIIVRGIKFWKQPHTIRGMEVELSNGHRLHCGHKHGEQSDMFYFKQDERITYMYVYGNGHCHRHGRTTGLYFRTNKGRYFNFYSQRRRGSPHNYNVGSGILVGFNLRCGADIDAMGPIFLRRIRSSILSQVTYPKLAQLSITGKPVLVDRVKYDNKKSYSSQTYKLTGTKTIQETAAWSRTSSLEVQMGSGFKVHAGVLILSLSSGIFRAKAGLSYTHNYEMSTSSKRSYEIPVTVPAGKKVLASAVMYEGAINTPYTGLVTHTLNTGRVIRYRVTGVYNGVTFSEVVFSTKEI
jgi:hypothetical protein